MIIRGGAGPQEAAAIAVVVALIHEEEGARRPAYRPEPSAWVAAVRQTRSRLRAAPPPPSSAVAGKPSRFVDQAH